MAKDTLTKKRLSEKLISGCSMIKGMCVMAAGFVVTGVSPLTVLAGNSEFDFLKPGASTNNAFEKAQQAVEQTGNSGVAFLRSVGAICLIVAIIMVGICLMMKKGQKLEEGKDRMLYVAVGGAIVFGAIGIGTMIAGLGQSL